MNSEPDLPADDPNALAAGIKAHLRWVQQRLREGIDEHEHERLLGERRYGPLDDPRDRGLASAWRAYEKVKQRCVETGCDPKHAPRIAWDFRPMVKEDPDLAWGLLQGVAQMLRTREGY